MVLLPCVVSGMEAVSEADLTRYTTEISKPGFLCAGLTYFAESFVDEAFFNSTIKVNPLGMSVLGLGGEASLGPLLGGFYKLLGRNVMLDVIPKAGHWIGMIYQKLEVGRFSWVIRY